jgi:hypothetical protein
VKIAEIVAISGADGLLYSRRSVRLRLSRLGATGAGFQSPKIKISHFGLKFHNTPRFWFKLSGYVGDYYWTLIE